MAFLGLAYGILVLVGHWRGMQKGVPLASLVTSRESPETVYPLNANRVVRCLLLVSVLGNLFSSADKEWKVRCG